MSGRRIDLITDIYDPEADISESVVIRRRRLISCMRSRQQHRRGPQYYYTPARPYESPHSTVPLPPLEPPNLHCKMAAAERRDKVMMMRELDGTSDSGPNMVMDRTGNFMHLGGVTQVQFYICHSNRFLSDDSGIKLYVILETDRREKLCEFCCQILPDWKVALTPPTGCRCVYIYT